MAVATRGQQVPRPGVERLRRHVNATRGQADATLRWLDEYADSLAPGPAGLAVAGLLVGHSRLARALDQPAQERPRPFADYAASSFGGDEQLCAELAEGTSVADLVSQLRLAVAETGDRIGRPEAPVVVRGEHGPVSLSDLLRLGIVEWLVAASDLAAAGGGPAEPDYDRAALGEGVRALAELLSARHPGHTIEVRIPPFAAVQIGSDADTGPTHTRGTPPNVVETDANTFVRLCAGRVSFSAARASGRVHASGARSDLAPMFPLL